VFLEVVVVFLDVVVVVVPMPGIPPVAVPA
jgi:hypothetical protein